MRGVRFAAAMAVALGLLGCKTSATANAAPPSTETPPVVTASADAAVDDLDLVYADDGSNTSQPVSLELADLDDTTNSKQRFAPPLIDSSLRDFSGCLCSSEAGECLIWRVGERLALAWLPGDCDENLCKVLSRTVGSCALDYKFLPNGATSVKPAEGAVESLRRD